MLDDQNEESFRFYVLLSNYLEFCRKQATETNESELWEMFENEKVTTLDVTRVIARLTATNLADTDKLQLVIFLRGLIGSKSGFLELFGVLIKANLLFVSLDISRIGTLSGLLANCSSSKMVRAYLISVLLTEGIDKWEYAIKAFYPVGYTITTLKTVRQIIGEPNSENINLYYWIYTDIKWGINEIKVFISNNDAEKDILWIF